MNKLIAIASVAATIAAGLFFVTTVQAETVVRDHRSKPIVRDHRKPKLNFCFGGPFGGYRCY